MELTQGSADNECKYQRVHQIHGDSIKDHGYRHTFDVFELKVLGSPGVYCSWHLLRNWTSICMWISSSSLVFLKYLLSQRFFDKGRHIRFWIERARSAISKDFWIIDPYHTQNERWCWQQRAAWDLLLPEFRDFSATQLALSLAVDLAEKNDFCINGPFEHNVKSLFGGRHLANSNKA